MSLKEVLAAGAALLLLSSVGQVAAQQSAPAAPPAQSAAPQESAVGDEEPAAAEVEEPETPALSPEEKAEEIERCKASRRRALNMCTARDYECRAVAMRRSQRCLADLGAR